MRPEFYQKNTFPPLRLSDEEAKDLYMAADGEIVEISFSECADLADINIQSRSDVGVRIVE